MVEAEAANYLPLLGHPDHRRRFLLAAEPDAVVVAASLATGS
jgi:hypothetical protein